MKNKNRVTMLEHMSDYGDWQWYGVYKNLTPKEALRSYAKEQSIDEKLIFTKDKEYLNCLYLENIEARAYTIELID